MQEGVGGREPDATLESGDDPLGNPTPPHRSLLQWWRMGCVGTHCATQAFVVSFEQTQSMIRVDADGQKHMNVSIQLWMYGLHSLEVPTLGPVSACATPTGLLLKACDMGSYFTCWTCGSAGVLQRRRSQITPLCLCAFVPKRFDFCCVHSLGDLRAPSGTHKPQSFDEA